MLWWRVLVGCGLVGLLGWGGGAHAELFEDVRRAMRVHVPQADMSGASVRGGVHLETGQAPSTATLFRAQARTGGTCGAFDFRGAMRQTLEEVPEMVTALLTDIGMQLPLLGICYLEPTWCDNIKHWQQYLNALINAKYAQCQSIQNAMAHAGIRLRGGATAQCLEEATGRGVQLPEALEACEGPITTIRRPDGTPGVEANLIRGTLAASGASEETLTLANALLGEVTLTTDDGQLHMQSRRPQAGQLAQYEAHRGTADGAMRRAVQEYQDTGTVTPETLRSVAVPGQTTPYVAIQALALLKTNDPPAFDSAVGKITTRQAVVRLTWQCNELERQLTAAVNGTTQLSDEARRGLEKQIVAAQRNLVHITQELDAAEKLQPVFDDLLRQYTAMQAAATQAGITTPTVTSRPGLYGTQTPLGYSR